MADENAALNDFLAIRSRRDYPPPLFPTPVRYAQVVPAFPVPRPDATMPPYQVRPAQQVQPMMASPAPIPPGPGRHPAYGGALALVNGRPTYVQLRR